jgi:hypothetical protein
MAFSTIPKMLPLSVQQFIKKTQIKCVISGLRSGVNEIFALLGCYTA